jgi:predicted SAM-dependent methyltransferase
MNTHSYLNLGCGTRFHPDWTNVDFESSCPHVISHNLISGIPFQNNRFDAVYHSHLVEHFSRSTVPGFMRECHRVLKPGGTIRIATPDFEYLAKVYLKTLHDLNEEGADLEADYEWITLHILDQLTREIPGGGMKNYLQRSEVKNFSFVYRMMGSEAMRIRENASKSTSQKLRDFKEEKGLIKAFKLVLRELKRRKYLRNGILKLILMREYSALEIGRFRQSGEPHHWLYDRHSLRQLMQSVGIRGIRVVSATESRIPDWKTYHLDTEPDGSIYKPDSLYMEGIK